jgi:hypothetical protein
MVGKRKFSAVTGAGTRQSTFIVKSFMLENKNTRYISDELLLLVYVYYNGNTLMSFIQKQKADVIT